MKYTKKPVTIEAIQWTGDNQVDVEEFLDGEGRFHGKDLFISTAEGMTIVSKDDYIIQANDGNLYSRKPEFFEKNYTESDFDIDTLYEFRKYYNAALFNTWDKMHIYGVHKSLRHYDGTPCFDGAYFIVSALLPTGLISNHYPVADWSLFKIPVVDKAKYEYDGHTQEDVLTRLKELTNK